MEKIMKYLIISLSLVISLNSFAKTKTKKVFNPDSTLRTEMNKISSKIRELGPLIASETEFTKDSNKGKIVKSITELQKSFSDLKKHPTIELQGLSINQLIMSEELKDVTGLVEKGKSVQGRAKLLSTLNLCVSCHSQSPGIASAKLFSDADISTYKINVFEKAELYFVTRDYEKSLSLYNQYLDSTKKSDDDELILRALERQLVYFVKIKKDFSLGKSYFESLEKKNKFSDIVQSEIKDWVKMLSGKPLWENYDPTVVKEEDMQKFMANFISDEEEGPIFTTTNSSEVYDLNLSSILLDYYNTHPETKLGGRILYWLAMLDKRLNDDLFFSLGDFYLLACMEKYNKDPISKECYEAYVEDMEINLVTDKKQKKNSELDNKLMRLRKLINYTDADMKKKMDASE
jgi:hypothetical protein